MKKKMLIVGLTGSFAGGKTTVARMFKNLGAASIDADKLYQDLLRDEKSGLAQRIVLAFGREILQADGEINRRKLGERVFNSSQELKRLTAITHPRIVREIKQEITRIKKENKDGMVIIDAPLLLEAGLVSLVDKLIVVKIKKAGQSARAVKRSGLSLQQIKKIINAQMPQREKLRLADYVIDNNGTKKETGEQVKVVWRKLMQREYSMPI